MRYVGIDIGAEQHVVAVVDESGAVQQGPTPCSEDVAGYARLDVEVVRALRREMLAGEEFHEGVTAVSVSHPIVFRSARLRNRGLYRARRLFTQSHPFDVAVRWEGFDDDGLTRVLGAWTVRDRLAIGGKYTLFEDVPEAVYLAAEFRNARYRRPAGSTAVAEWAAELRLRLGVEF